MELIIEDNYEKMQCKIYIKEQQRSETAIIGYDGKSLIKYILPIKEEMEVKPLLTIPFMMKDALIRAFISEGAKSNLRTDNENLLKGKLEATELHLKDMREISQKLLDNKFQVINDVNYIPHGKI